MTHYYRSLISDLSRSNDAFVTSSPFEGVLPISCSRIGLLLATSDFLLIIALDHFVQRVCHPIATSHLAAGPIGTLIYALSAVLYCLVMEAQDQYSASKWRTGSRTSSRAIASWMIVLFILSALVFFAKAGAEISRATVIWLFCSGLILLPLWRYLSLKTVSWMLDRHMFAVCARAVVVSVAGIGHHLDAHQCRNLKRHGKSVVGRLTVDRVDAGAVARLKTLLATQRVDEIWFSCPMDKTALAEAADALKAFPLPVFWLADQTYCQFHALPTEDLGLVKALKVQGGPLTQAQQRIKRCLDITMAAVGIVLLIPLFIFVALAIKFDSRGPVLFTQRRSGFNNQTFQIYKFRSMTTADDGPEILQATRNDQRVTRVGRVLRRSSLDELPQLFNVIRGDMSVVGPRPHALCHDTQYSQLIETYALRYHVKPGITGWAQSKGCRGETKTLADMERRVDLDLWYIKNWSLWTDVKAIFGTLRQLAGSPNAY